MPHLSDSFETEKNRKKRPREPLSSCRRSVGSLVNNNVYLCMVGGSLSVRALCKYRPPFLMAVKRNEQASVGALANYLHELECGRTETHSEAISSCV